MITKKDLFRFLFILVSVICLINLTGSGAVKAGTIISLEDPEGDENGPGTYIYPTHKHFAPHQGLFDLTRFIIREEKDTYIFELSFTRITNPWQAHFGFSHPLIEIYFDNKEGGETVPFRPGARVRFSERAPWDFLLKCTGWWVRGFRPEDREIIDQGGISWNAPDNPRDIKGAKAQVLDDFQTIRIKVPADVFELKGNFYVLVGSFDPFGYDHFREVAEKPSSWEFGGGDKRGYHPRVIDILDVPGKEQAQILGSYDPEKKSYACLEPIAIKKRVISGNKFLIWILVLIAVITGIFILYSRRTKEE